MPWLPCIEIWPLPGIGETPNNKIRYFLRGISYGILNWEYLVVPTPFVFTFYIRATPPEVLKASFFLTPTILGINIWQKKQVNHNYLKLQQLFGNH